MSLSLKIIGRLIGVVFAGLFLYNFDIVPRTDHPAPPSDAPALSRDEQILKDCADLKGGLWVEDRDGDGLVPEIAIINFQPNYLCVVSGVPRSGYIHISITNQIGRDTDDYDNVGHPTR